MTEWRERPRRLLWFAAALALIGAALATTVYPRLTAALSDYDDPESSVSMAQQQLLDATGTNPEEGYVLLVRSTTVLDPAAPPPPVVTHAADVLRRRPEVVSVADYTSTHNPALISRDAHQTYVLGAVGHADGKSAVAALRSTIAADPLLRESVVLGGSTVANVEVAEISIADLGRAELFAVPLLLIGLLIVFRGAVAAVVPLLGAAFSVLVAFAGLVAAMTFMSVSIFSMNLMTALGMGLAVDFSLLVITRFREELTDGASVACAVRNTRATAGRTVLFSAATITACMTALLIFPQRFLYSMGLAGALVAAAAAVYALVVLPALLLILGTKINALAPRAWHRRHQPADRGRWYRIAHAVMRRPVLYATAVGTALIVLGVPFMRVGFSFYDADVLPATSGSAQVSAALSRDFAHAVPAPTVLVVSATVDPVAIDRYTDRVRNTEGVTVVGPIQHLDGGLWRIDVGLSDPPMSSHARHTVTSLEQLAAPAPVHVSGETARFSALLDSLANRLPYAVALMLTLSSIVLFVMTGSVALPLKNILMNVLTLSATFGVVVAVFQWGWAGSALRSVEVTSLVLVGILASGLSTDYAVFLLARIKSERDQGHSTREAVAVGVERTAPVVSAAATLMFIPLVAMTTSQLGPVRELGFAAGLAVLIDATVVRVALVPALMALLGRWNWAAPSMLHRLHIRLATLFDDKGFPEPSELPSSHQPAPI